MINTYIQTTLESISNLLRPDEETIRFALVIVDLVLMVQITDIDYHNDYRKALVWVRESLELELGKIENRKVKITGEFHD